MGWRFVSLNMKITTLLYVSVVWLRKYMCYFLRGLLIYYKHRRISNAFRWWPARNSGFHIEVLNLFPFFHLSSLSYHNAIITIYIKTLSCFFNSVLYLYHSRIPLVAWSQVIFEVLIYDRMQSQKKISIANVSFYLLLHNLFLYVFACFLKLNLYRHTQVRLNPLSYKM